MMYDESFNEQSAEVSDEADDVYDFASKYGNIEYEGTWNAPIKEEETPQSGFLENTNVISGTGIIEEEEEDGESLSELMKNVNSHNVEAVEKESKRLRAKQEAREEADRRFREEAQRKLLQERYEEEQKERERIRIKEEEDARRLEEELEAKKKANPLFRMKELAANMAKDAALNIAAKTEEKKKAKEIKPEPEEKKEEGKAVKISQEPEAGNGKESKKKQSKKENATLNKKNKKETEKTEESTPDFEYLATHDQLTGLQNFTAYDMAVKSCNVSRLAILFFDVNNLKETNDTLGHAMGNKLITTAANALEELFPGSVYRIGGDEFVVLCEEKKDVSKIAEGKIAKFQAKMSQATKDDTDGLTYSVSAGYAVGDGKKTAEEIRDEADKAMYANKQAYKASQKKKKKAAVKKSDIPLPDYDSMLSEEQRMLKGVIKDNHCQASEESTEKILREIQSRCNEIVAVLVASPTFDNLFVMQDVENFVNLVAEMDNLIDYSYLYVVYENGTQFYGIDEYFDEVTDLFKEIGCIIKSSPYVSDKELLKIKGINVFKHIYID